MMIMMVMLHSLVSFEVGLYIYIYEASKRVTHECIQTIYIHTMLQSEYIAYIATCKTPSSHWCIYAVGVASATTKAHYHNSNHKIALDSLESHQPSRAHININ